MKMLIVNMSQNVMFPNYFGKMRYTKRNLDWLCRKFCVKDYFKTNKIRRKDKFYNKDYKLALKRSYILIHGLPSWGFFDKPVKIYLTTTNCNYGGKRVWFGCPGCGRRVYTLYHYKFNPNKLLCRYCLNLTYNSKVNGRKRMYKLGKLIRRQQWIQNKLIERKVKSKTVYKLYKEMVKTNELIEFKYSTEKARMDCLLLKYGKKVSCYD